MSEYVVKSKDGDWVKPDLGMTDDILCAGLWSETRANEIAETRGRFRVLRVEDAWDNWYKHHGPDELTGTMMEWLATGLNSLFIDQVHIELPDVVPNGDDLRRMLRARRERMN